MDNEGNGRDESQRDLLERLLDEVESRPELRAPRTVARPASRAQGVTSASTTWDRILERRRRAAL